MIIYEIEDICGILKISKSTAYSLVQKKELHAFKLHGIWKITDEALSDYLAKALETNSPL
jgi:excisionase family DNA binding protein